MKDKIAGWIPLATTHPKVNTQASALYTYDHMINQPSTPTSSDRRAKPSREGEDALQLATNNKCAKNQAGQPRTLPTHSPCSVVEWKPTIACGGGEETSIVVVEWESEKRREHYVSKWVQVWELRVRGEGHVGLMRGPTMPYF